MTRQNQTKKTTKKTTKKPSKKAHTPPQTVNDGQGVSLLDEQVATMWSMRIEGHSLREIAQAIGCHARTVSREFAKDPTRHAALVAVLAEERAAKWKQIEHQSIDLIVRMMNEIKASLFTPTGRRRKFRSNKERDDLLMRLDLLRKIIGPVRMAADSSTKMSQLLTGGPTQILGGSVQGSGLGIDPSQMTDDEMIIFAVEHGLVEDLPQRLREKHTKMRDRGEVA